MEKEIRVYVVIIDPENNDFDFSRLEREGRLDEIKDEAERQGNVYSLKGFQSAFNAEHLSTEDSFILID